METDLAMWIAGFRALIIFAAFAAFAWALLRARRESAEQLERLAVAQQEARDETRALSVKVSALATLLAAIPTRLERPAEAPAPMPRREPSQARSYETARRLARNGATVEEIVATCGVAGTEARLLRRLHAAGSERDSAA